MMQTRLSSLIEAVINVAIGFVVSLVITALVLPAYGHDVTWSQNLQITGIFSLEDGKYRWSEEYDTDEATAIRAAIKLLKANGYRVTQPKEHA